MDSIKLQETVVYRRSVWEVRRIRHDDNGWTASVTLISEIPEGAKTTRHFYSSTLTSETVTQNPLNWIREYVDTYRK